VRRRILVRFHPYKTLHRNVVTFDVQVARVE